MGEERLKQITIYLGVFHVALLLNTMPPLMLEFQRVFQLSITKSGLIPASHSFGTVLANLSTIYLLYKVGTMKIAWSGIASSFLGLILISFTSSFYFLCLGIFLLAFSFGLTISSFSTQISYFREDNRNFSLFHSFFGLGGFMAPIFVSYEVSKRFGYKKIYLFYFVLLLIYSILLKKSKMVNHKVKGESFKAISKNVFTKENILLMLLAGFYASTEMSLVIWAGNFFSIKHGFSIEKVSYFISIFWLLFTISRMFGDYQIKKLGIVKNSLLMAVISIVSIICLIFFNANISSIAFVLTGLFIATIFPSIHSLLNLNKNDCVRGMLNASLFFSVSFIGFFFVPLIGAVAEHNLVGGMLITIVPLLAILCFLPNKLKN